MNNKFWFENKSKEEIEEYVNLHSKCLLDKYKYYNEILQFSYLKLQSLLYGSNKSLE